MRDERKKDIELSNLNTSEKISYDELIRDESLSFSQKVLDVFKRRFFIVNWLPHYDRTKAIGDFISGVTIGLTMIPQSLAYANLANVPAVYGSLSELTICAFFIFKII